MSSSPRLSHPDCVRHSPAWAPILDRIGWKFNMIHKGDEITAIVAPLRSGEPGALLKLVTLADGKQCGNRAPAGPALIQ